MPPSCDLPGSRQPRASFCSVDWLSQSSCAGPAHTSRPTRVSWGGLSAPARVPGSGEPLQTWSVAGAKAPGLTVPGAPAAGLRKEPGPTRAPRIRRAFTAAQVSTLESSFQLRQYLGPLERKKLAREMQLSEVQVKTWFQNRRMKHKRQMPDSQLHVPFSGRLCSALALCPPPSALGGGLHLLYPGASPPGPHTLMLPACSFCSPYPLEPVSLGSTWASCSLRLWGLPDPGSQLHRLGPPLSGAHWSLGTLSEPRDALEEPWRPESLRVDVPCRAIPPPGCRGARCSCVLVSTGTRHDP